jgi:signal transduction histidine kinase
MTLAEFIRTNSDRILREWEDFASRISDAALPRWILRDHAASIVNVIADRMEASSPPVEQRLVAAIEGEPSPTQYVTAAHVKIRIDSGFDLAQIAAEYCVLRACVARLWQILDPNGFEVGAAELARFSEIVDENITAAVVDYKERESQYRDRFIGILGHDLRNPINAIVMGANVLAKQHPINEQQLKVVASILKSARRLEGMSRDILDFARGRLGSPMPLTIARENAGVFVGEVVDEIRLANPESVIDFEASGHLDGEWDGERLKQMVSNLLINAIQHGDSKSVKVTVQGDESLVVIQVHNGGPVIPEDLLPTIFDPLTRRGSTRPDSTGLGLFIASEIVAAHGGTIVVSSSREAGTNFVVRLPHGPS